MGCIWDWQTLKILTSLRHFQGYWYWKVSSTSRLHAFTGCDRTSFFAHLGKKTAWEAWEAFVEVTKSFQVISNASIPNLERYVTIMYDCTNTCNETMRLGKICSHGRGEILRPFLPRLMPSTQNDPRTKLGIAWARLWCHFIPSLVQVNGSGRTGPIKGGNHYLKPFPKQHAALRSCWRANTNLRRACRKCKCVQAEPRHRLCVTAVVFVRGRRPHSLKMETLGLRKVFNRWISSHHNIRFFVK